MKSEEGPGTWKCNYCSKQFKYESEKLRHEISHVPQFECKVCLKKFSFVSALRRHEKQHQRTGSASCNKCGGKFRDETLLKRHIQYAHKGTFSCTECTTTFSSETALNIHMKTHKPESERQYRCSYQNCGKTFNFPHHLKHHELTHSNSKQYFCKECGKGFIQSHHLKIHTKMHEPSSWLPCPVLKCSKIFYNEYALKRHLATHKEKTEKAPSKLDIPKEDKDNTKHCTTCDQKFTKRQYSKHILTCVSKENKDIFDNATLECSINEISLAIEESDAKEKDFGMKKETENENAPLIELGSNDCKSILGECIVSGDSETNADCLCAQITGKVEDDRDDDIIIPKSTNLSENIQSFKCIDEKRKEMNACEGCECASLCGANKIANNYESNYETPELEYRNDGIIKIKETFDIDMGIDRVNNRNITDYESDCKGVKEAIVNQVNSCKDVLGNCIISGTGTIGDGCLCAKMIADDQQMIAQEIEEITPCPKNTWLSQRL